MGTKDERENQQDLKWKALSEPVRRYLLDIISLSEKNVGDLATASQLDPGTLSHHLKVLLKAGLIGVRKEGRFRDYFLRAEACDELLGWLRKIRQDPMGIEWAKESYREDVLYQFLNGARIPAHPRQKRIVQAWLLGQLESGRLYAEEEVRKLLPATCPGWQAFIKEMEQEGLIVLREGYILLAD